MKFRTEVEIAAPVWRIEPSDRILCVGSCFAQRIGDRLGESGLQTTVNPWGTLYNPASIADALNSGEVTGTSVLIVTLGTTHVYLRDGKVVANCQKLPARLFTERELDIAEVVEALGDAIERMHAANPTLRVILTVSPYRYAKYGMHGSQLSKARLLLAVDELIACLPYATYFPAYEIVLDELRDYRFYDADMLHPSQQAVDYIWERFCNTMLSRQAQCFVREMEPVRKALAHRPFDPESAEYRHFIEETREREREIREKFLSF